MDKPNVVLEREKLYDEVWSKPMIKLAREYGLSDNGLRKICKKLRIPVPSVGYWAKLEHGKKVDRMPLPPAHNFPTTHEIAQNREPKTKIVEPPELQEVIDFEGREQNQIKVPTDLLRPHPLVKQTKEAFRRSKPNHFGILEANPLFLEYLEKGSFGRRACRPDPSRFSENCGPQIRLHPGSRRNETFRPQKLKRLHGVQSNKRKRSLRRSSKD